MHTFLSVVYFYQQTHACACLRMVEKDQKHYIGKILAFRPNSILMNRGLSVIPLQSHSTQWIDSNTNIKKKIELDIPLDQDWNRGHLRRASDRLNRSTKLPPHFTVFSLIRD